MAKNAVATVETNLPATQTDISGFAQFEGLGGGEVRTEDMSLPFLKILAQLSPQVNKRDGAYIQGAEPGMIWDTLTNKVYDGEEGIEVVPCYFQPRLLEWTPKSLGGGFRGSYPVDDPIRRTATLNADKKLSLPNGNELVETAQFFLIFREKEEGPQRRIVAMSSSQLKKSRKWVTQLMSQQGRRADGTMFSLPFFANRYRLRTVAEQNDKGSWFGWDISRIGPVDLSNPEEAALLPMGVAFAKAIGAGEVEVKHSRDDEAATGRSIDADDIPF